MLVVATISPLFTATSVTGLKFFHKMLQFQVSSLSTVLSLCAVMDLRLFWITIKSLSISVKRWPVLL